MSPTGIVTSPRRERDDDSPSGRVDDSFFPLSRLLDRWRLLVGLAVSGAIVGIAVAAVFPKHYEASALLIVTPPSDPEAATPSLTTFRTFAETQVIAERALSDATVTAAKLPLTPQRFLENHLFVDEVRGTNLLRVRVRLRDPSLAAHLANAVAREMLSMQQSLNGGGRTALAGQSKAQLMEAEARLIAAEKRLGDYQRGAQLELVREDADSRLALRASVVPLLVEIETEKARLAAAETEIARQAPLLSYPRLVDVERALSRQMETTSSADPPKAPERTNRLETGQREQKPSDPERRESSGKPEERDRESPRDRRRSGAEDRRVTIPEAPAPSDNLATVDTDNPFVNPVYQILQFQIASSRTKLAGLERRRRELLSTHAIGAETLKQLAGVHEIELQLGRLEADVELARRIRDDLSLNYEELSRSVLTRSAGIQVIDHAGPPERPIWPKPSLFAATGLLVAVLLGAALVFLQSGQLHRA